jgi:hypothetical protein
MPPQADCPHPVDRNVALGEQLGINGTPTLIAGDGRVLRGCRQPRPDRGLAVAAGDRRLRRSHREWRPMKGAHPAASSRPPCRPLRLAALVAGTAALGLSGCASNLSGIGGTPTYACKAPAGAQCTSVSGVYANAGQGARQLLGSDALRTGGSGALGTPAADAALTRTGGPQRRSRASVQRYRHRAPA